MKGRERLKCLNYNEKSYKHAHSLDHLRRVFCLVSRTPHCTHSVYKAVVQTTFYITSRSSLLNFRIYYAVLNSSFPFTVVVYTRIYTYTIEGDGLPLISTTAVCTRPYSASD